MFAMLLIILKKINFFLGRRSHCRRAEAKIQDAARRQLFLPIPHLNGAVKIVI